MMVHTPYNPSVRLFCKRCGKQTAHMLIDFSNNPLSALVLVYECQECGEVKKIFDLNTLPELKVSSTSEGESREIVVKSEDPAIPIERGPQIDR